MLRKMPAILLFVFFMMACLGASFAEEGSTIHWQGHTLVAEKITAARDEVHKVFVYPTPEVGYHALVLLRIEGGSVISEGDLNAHMDQFRLTRGEYEGYPSTYLLGPNPAYDIALLFLMRPSSGSHGPDLALSVQLPETNIPAGLADVGLLWQDQQVSVVAFTDERALLWEHEWPENGYLAEITFQSPSIDSDTVFAYAHEFVLASGEGHEHELISVTRSTRDGQPVFSLIYRIAGDPPPSTDSLSLDVQPRPALWMDDGFRHQNTKPLKSFVPQSPTARTVAIALEDTSKYEFGSKNAILNPEEALRALHQELQTIRADLIAMFDEPITVASDPGLASVVIGVNISFPLAGEYGDFSPVKAYNAELTLTAYDAMTQGVIAEYTAGHYYGSSISVTPGTTVVWKNIPTLSDTTGYEDAFVPALEAFWQNFGD